MLNEVAPPGYGHTKSDKEKGVKKGGTAAAFDRARKEGRFKGSKSDMFAIMWSQKNKGDKPHYKPGTNEKKKKYQDESFEIDSKAHKKVQRQAKIRNLAKGNENPNEKSAAERKLKGPKLVGEAKKLKDNNIPQKERKNINYRYKNLHKQDLTGTVGEEVSRRNKPSAIKKKKTLEKLLIDKEVSKIQKESTMKKEMTYQEAIDAGWEMTGEGIWMPPQTETVTEKISFPSFKKKVAERKPEKAQDAGAKARRAMKRREHAKYVSGSEDNVPDDMRD